MGNLDDASAAYERAIQLAARTYGTGHPEYWRLGSNNAELLHMMGQRDAGIERFEALRHLVPDPPTNAAGWTVLTANDGAEAVHAWQRAHDAGHAPDLLVTDLGLPDIDGPSLARSLRERDPHLFVIALTGYPERDTEWSGPLLDRTAFFQKPIMAATLLAAAHALTLQGTRLGDEACPLDPLPALHGTDGGATSIAISRD